MNLNTEPSIIGMANSLDLDADRPVEAITEYCRAKVAKFLRRAGKIASVNELLRVVCQRLNLDVREIWTDEDLAKWASHYLAGGEIAIYAAVQSQFRADTFGMLLQVQRPDADGRTRFVAFIDCRGEKSHRRVFTLWHEIAHCLTVKDQLALPLRRTTAEMIEKDPVEKLTDIIAGDFAFYEPLFRPILRDEAGTGARLTFNIVDHVRSRFNPDASFCSTLHACVAMFPAPTILVEAGLAYKKAEQDQIDSGLAKASDFTARLRVARSIPNELAREALPHVPKKMRIPEESIITKIYADDFQAVLEGSAKENLRSWTTSTGGGLRNVEVTVEARKFKDTVIALIARAA